MTEAGRRACAARRKTPRALDARLQAAGANYYVRNSDGLDIGADNVLIRLVTSFSTADDDIERFVSLCKKS